MMCSFRKTPMTYQERISRDPAICAGQPTIRGTRVLVRVVLGYLAHGEPVQRIPAEFPSLTEEKRARRDSVRGGIGS